MSVESKLNRLLFKNGSYYYPIKAEEIIYLVADGAYTTIHLEGKEISVSKSLKLIASKLDPLSFCRIHHSTIINLQHITRFSKVDDNSVEMSNGKQLSISMTWKKNFYQVFRTIWLLKSIVGNGANIKRIVGIIKKYVQNIKYCLVVR